MWRGPGGEGGAVKVGLRVGDLDVVSPVALLRRIRKRRGRGRRKGRRGMKRRRTGMTSSVEGWHAGVSARDSLNNKTNEFLRAPKQRL